MTRYTAAAAFVLATFAVFAEKQPYERYRSIVDRQMFGPLPEGFDPTKMPSEVARSSGGGRQDAELSKEQEKLQSAVRFSVINVTPSGETAVGFTDNSDPKTPVHYYLKVGEERGGWKVESADPKTATMTISKGEIEVTLTIGGSSGKGGETVAKRGRPAGGGADASVGATLGGRRRLRRIKAAEEIEKIRKESAEKEAERAEREAEREAREAEEKAQREAERAEQRKQLMDMAEALRKVRDAQNAENGDGENENDNAE